MVITMIDVVARWEKEWQNGGAEESLREDLKRASCYHFQVAAEGAVALLRWR